MVFYKVQAKKGTHALHLSHEPLQKNNENEGDHDWTRLCV